MVTVTITGQKKIIRSLERKERLMTKHLNNAIHDAGFFYEGEVKESIAGRRAEPTSVDTGNLMRSVGTDNKQEFMSVVSTPVGYAKFIEFGTSKFGSRPHFRNSLRRNEKKIIRFVRDKIKGK